jgi:hypothetical protein
VFEIGLRGQFNVLWNVTDQLVNISKNAIQNISTLTNQVIGLGSMNITTLVENCTINIQQQRKKRSSGSNEEIPSFPNDILQDASHLINSGIIGGNGTLYCQSKQNNHCWNGQESVINFTAAYDHIYSSLEDLISNNPYIQLDLNTIRQQVTALDNPVTDFLSSQPSLPQGLAIPHDASASSITSQSCVILYLLLAAAIISLSL